MRKLVSIFIVSTIALWLSPLALAQDGPARAELECLMLSRSSGVAEPSAEARFASFHHVWIPGLRYGYFESNGTNLLYEVEGEGNETVVVVHGGPGLPHEYFHPLLSSLGRHVKMVYFDRRADFRSARIATEMATIDEMADDIDALRKTLGLDRVTLLAHSFGGAIALNYALRYSPHVKRLVLVGTSAVIENPAQVESRILKTFSQKELAAYRSNEGSAAAATACDRVRKQYRALYPRYFHRQPDPDMLDRGVYSAYFDSLARKMLLASDEGGFDVRPYLDRIKAPTLVIAGRHDLVTPPEQAKEMAQALPHSRLVVLENSGHFPFFEENYMFTEWVRGFILGTKDLRDDRITSAPNMVRSGAQDSRTQRRQ